MAESCVNSLNQSLITIDGFLNYFPEFSSVDKTVIERYILEAEIITDLKRCPQIGTLMHLYYTAHAIAKSSSNPTGMDDGVGAVTGQTVGGVSETRDVGTITGRSYSDNWYNTSPYGAKFLQLRAKCFGGGLVVP